MPEQNISSPGRKIYHTEFRNMLFMRKRLLRLLENYKKIAETEACFDIIDDLCNLNGFALNRIMFGTCSYMPLASMEKAEYLETRLALHPDLPIPFGEIRDFILNDAPIMLKSVEMVINDAFKFGLADNGESWVSFEEVRRDFDKMRKNVKDRLKNDKLYSRKAIFGTCY